MLKSVEDRNPTFKGLLAGLLLVVIGTVFGTGVVAILVWAVRLVQEWVR